MKITKSIIAIVFAVSLILGMITFICGEKKTFSENENKNLATFPKLSFKSLESGDFTADLEEYMKDHFPARDSLMKLKTKAQLLAGYKKIGDVHIGNKRLFQSVNLPDSTPFVSSCNKLFGNISPDIKTAVMLLPSASQVYKDELPAFTQSLDEKALIDDILSQIPGTAALNITDVFSQKKQENNLFYFTDHHWTTFGAFYGYEFLCDTLGISHQPIDKYEILSISDSFKGTLYSKVLDDSRYDTVVKFESEKISFDSFMTRNVTKSPEPFPFYSEEFLEMKDKYSYFGGGNFPLLILESKNCKNGNEIVVVKDSFANAMMPFLTENFEKVHIIDPRYFKGKSVSAYINENQNVTTVLVLYGINSLNDGVTNFS